jgi:hypothetical protein
MNSNYVNRFQREGWAGYESQPKPTMNEELKPCPHCGGEAMFSTSEDFENSPFKKRYIRCVNNCQPYSRNDEDLIRAWNTRQQQPVTKEDIRHLIGEPIPLPASITTTGELPQQPSMRKLKEAYEQIQTYSNEYAALKMLSKALDEYLSEPTEQTPAK